MIKPIQLFIGVSAGDQKAPVTINPDGTESPFSIPNDMAFVVTDISIQRVDVIATIGFFWVSLNQLNPSGTFTPRWTFVGSYSQNIERSFITGIKFTTPFVVANGSQSTEGVAVNLFGYFDWL